ncbi:DEKNAAC100544 [Brettanomyces naardenensis]|uniref:DEKNAAC100544 n=1 Tax=Brettanomyces naardenensis TaxID=13370 RepID=A0A448YFR8_BRENA|nr:DEKNAAC100544 [Brettanomyces naardenensis]
MSLADRKVSDEKFDQIYEEIVGSRPPKWVKDESRKRAYVRSVSEDGENGPDRYIHDLRRSISPSVVEESNARLKFLALLGQTRDLLRSSSNVQDSFHELLTVYKKLPKPSIYAMRNRDLEKLSSIITDCLLQSGVDLSDDELLSIKSFFDESLDNGYGLTRKEYHSYCAVLTSLKYSQLDDRLEVLQKLRMAGVDIDSVYVGTTLSTVGNHHDWHSLQSFLEADGGVKKDVSTLIWVKGMELSRKEKDMLWFLALLQQFIDSYRISDFSSRVMNQEVLNSLLAFGFYSTSKRILTSLLLIDHDPLRTANPANLQLLDNFIRLGTIPKAYVLSNLKPDVRTFEPFFRHLSKFPGSKKEMSELIDMILDHRLHLGDNIIWFILENVGEFQGWKRRQVADLILELDSKPSNIMINHTEFVALRSIFDFYRFKEVTNKRIRALEYHKGLTRSECLRYFLDNYKLE